MKILLAACNAKYIHSNLAVYDLQAYASEYADHIVLKEYTINQLKDDIMRDIYLEMKRLQRQVHSHYLLELQYKISRRGQLFHCRLEQKA